MATKPTWPRAKLFPERWESFSRNLSRDGLTTLDRAFAPHLTIRDSSLPPAFEWTPRPPVWALLQITAGIGYWMDQPINQELQPGTLLLLSAGARGTLRASCLGDLRFQVFSVEPERLTGLLTLNEQRFLEAATTLEKFSVRIFSPESPIATAMQECCLRQPCDGSRCRLQLLQLFIGAFNPEINQGLAEPPAPRNAKERLQDFLRQTPTSELLHLSVAELAQRMGCTPRHLNRIFHEVVGNSFRDKHTELRLARACELLASTQSKVVDVALESGYQSLSLFNLMFTRRFGISPGKWRRWPKKRKVLT